MNKEKIVVLGGSFNPPTIAHLMLIKTAVQAVDASKGIFVPAPFEYVQRKLKRAGYKQEALSDELRLEMLNAMTERSSGLTVDDCEMHREKRGFTFETLEQIGEKYPDAEIYFIVGSDKLHIIPRWHRIEEFLERFKILAAKRDGENPVEIILQNSFLSEHKSSFRVFTVPDELEGVSSSAFREKLRNNDETAKNMVCKGVWEILRNNGKIPWECIDHFRDTYDFLSNFYPVKIEYSGLTYQNAEAVFQAQKCLSDEERAEFCELPANTAKRVGRQVKLRDDWEDVKIQLMEEIVRAKFAQNSELAKKLISTDDIPLIEGNTWGDKFWGVDIRTGQGENNLGKILMKIRAEIKAKKLAESELANTDTSFRNHQPVEQKAENAYDYLELSDKAESDEQALKYAEKALQLEPDNWSAEAKIIDLTTFNSEVLIYKYKKLIAQANDEMEKEGWFREEHIGSFCEINETKPYMLLRESYFDALINRGMMRQAAAEGEDMLRLSKNDDIGMRYWLMHIYAYLEDEQSALNLLNGLGKYTQKETMILLPLSVLYYKLGDFVKSQNYLYELKNKNTDTLEFFELMAVEYRGRYDEIEMPLSYYPFSMDEFFIAVARNKFLFFNIPQYFDWGLKKLRK